MRLQPLPWVSAEKINFRPLLLLCGVVLGLASSNAATQTAAYVGKQIILPISGLELPGQIAVDSAGNLFVENYDYFTQSYTVLEYSKTATGYGSGETLPILVNSPVFALDKDDDIFFFDDRGTTLSELPKTSNGYGAQITLPIDLGTYYYFESLAVDSSGDVFVITAPETGGLPWNVTELPKTQTGYGSEITITSGSTTYTPGPIAVDNEGNLFFNTVNYTASGLPSQIIELPKTTTGYGPQVQLPATGLYLPLGMAVDGSGNLFVVDYENRIMELVKTATGYSQPLLVASHIGQGGDVAIDSSGNLYVPETDGGKILEVLLQTPVSFGTAYACAPEQSKPAPCTQTLRLNFAASPNVTLGTPQIVSLDAPELDYTLASSGTCTGLQSADSGCFLTATFAPQAAGTRNGVVEILDNKGNLLSSTPITGLGLSPSDVPQAQVSPATLQFGTIPFGTSETLPVTVTNIGGGTLNVTSASIDAKSFTIAGNTCTTGLTSGQSCTLQVQLNPINIAAFDTTLTIQTNASSSTSTVALEAIASGITVAGAPFEFGSVVYGSKSVLLLTVVNHWLPGTVTLQTSLPGSSFAILQNSQNTCTAGIVSGGSCTLPVQFAPDGIGPHFSILTLTPSGGGTAATVGLHGDGSGLIPGTSYLQFGTIPLGSTAVLPLTVTNHGLPGTVLVDVATGPSYPVIDNAQNTCQAGIASGQTCTLLIEFSPVGAGGHNGILTLTPSSGGVEGITVALEGSASAP